MLGFPSMNTTLVLHYYTSPNLRSDTIMLFFFREIYIAFLVATDLLFGYISLHRLDNHYFTFFTKKNLIISLIKMSSIQLDGSTKIWKLSDNVVALDNS